MFRRCVSLNYNVAKRYAGHSKWANIRHVKGIKDAERSFLFTRLSRQIKVAVTLGGSIDPKANLQLHHLIEQCKRVNMPVATIQSILKNCETDKSNSKPYTLELRGPGSSILLCEIFTSNLHGSKSAISAFLRKHQTKYADGVRHLFEEKAIVEAENEPLSAQDKNIQIEQATDHAIESNAEEVNVTDDNVFQFLSSKTQFAHLQSKLEKLGYKIVNASVEYIPLQPQKLEPSQLDMYKKLKGKLEALPDVVRVIDNVDDS